jgi:hypothetical protein
MAKKHVKTDLLTSNKWFKKTVKENHRLITTAGMKKFLHPNAVPNRITMC